MQPLHCMVFLSEGCTALTEQDGPGRTTKASIKDRNRKKNPSFFFIHFRKNRNVQITPERKTPRLYQEHSKKEEKRKKERKP